MPEMEKQAWFLLSVVIVTIATYFAFVAFAGFVPATSASFALLGLTGLPAFRHKKELVDERDREIANKADLVGSRVFWVVFVAVPMVIGFSKGWDSVLLVPVWTLTLVLYVAVALVVGVRALTAITLYRKANHA
jgi:uncharacterized membrane protein (DUF485 family)